MLFACDLFPPIIIVRLERERETEAIEAALGEYNMGYVFKGANGDEWKMIFSEKLDE